MKHLPHLCGNECRKAIVANSTGCCGCLQVDHGGFLPPKRTLRFPQLAPKARRVFSLHLRERRFQSQSSGPRRLNRHTVRHMVGSNCDPRATALSLAQLELR